MGRPTIFDEALVKLGSREVTAGTTAESLRKELFDAADTLYNVRGSVRAITTDAINDACEGYAVRLGPIPSDNLKALGLAKDLRDTASLWDMSLGRIADDMEWLGRTLSKFPKVAGSVKQVQLRTRPLGEGVTTQDFVKALTEGAKVLLQNMKETQNAIKTVQAEIDNPMGLFQHSDVLTGAKELVERQGVWEKRTKALAEGFKGLAAALKTKTARMDEALTKLATMDDAKRSRFEEGKPADPTENMNPEDAAEWKKQNDENKDNFKSASKADRTAAFDAALLKLGK